MLCHIYTGTDLAITATADGLAPGGARPSVGTCWTKKLSIFSSSYLSSFLPMIDSVSHL